MKLGIKRKVAAAAAAVGMLGGMGAIGLATTSAASAAGATHCASHGCDIYNRPGSDLLSVLPGEFGVHMVCWTAGPMTDGSKKWFKVTDLIQNGYVPANEVVNQTIVGLC